jgi:dienelactone hydrolase
MDEQGLIGDFYYCPDVTNKFGILLLGGSEGGKPRVHYLMESLATNGYPTLGLAYFKEKGLPESLQLIPLEYFDRAIEWMAHNKKIPSGRIVVIGGSRGAELALLLAATNPKIKGVIALSPSSVVWNGMPKELPMLPCSSWTVDGKPVPYIPYDSETNAMPGDMHDIYKYFQTELTKKEAVQNAAIKVERIQGPVLLASGADDALWPAADMADAICSRLKENGFQFKIENLKYKDAGHTLDERWMLGGTFEGNKEARIDFNNQLLAFLKAIK